MIIPSLLLPTVANYIRGRGYTKLGRGAVCTSFALVVLLNGWGYGFYNAVGMAIMVAACAYLWLMFGWGKYFSSFTGRDNPNEAEIGWIDWIGYKVFPYDMDARTNRLRGLLCMSIRGLFFYPAFIAIYGITGNWWALLIGLGTALQGYVYYIQKEDAWAVARAEILTGLLFGSLIWLAV